MSKEKIIEILDTTLRDGEQAPGNTMEPEQKLEVAYALKNLNVNIIEAGFPINDHDFKAVELIAENIKDLGICALARCKKEDIDTANKALIKSKNRYLHLFYPVSRLSLRTKFGIGEKDSLKIISEHIKYASNYFDNIIFSAEDATRSNLEHLLSVFKIAYESGAQTLDIADTVGYAQPSEIIGLVKKTKQNFPNAKIGVHCHNDLGLATSNTLAGIKAGADHIQVTVNGIGERSGNAALEEVVMALNIRENYYHSNTPINPNKIYETSNLLYKILKREPSNEKAIVGKNSFSHEAGIHVSSIIKEPKTYEMIEPKKIGRKSSLIIGKHSNRNFKSIKEAYSVIKKGGLTIIPSRVGYTLLGNSDESIKKMFKLKNRPLGKPAIILTKRDKLDVFAEIPKKYNKIIDSINDKNLLCSFVLKRNKNPIYNSLAPFTNEYSQKEGTSCFVINPGEYLEYLVEKSLEDDILIVGSSANISGTGNEGIFTNLPEQITKKVDYYITDDDFIKREYNPLTRDRGVILDLSKNKLTIIRKGLFYDQIKNILKIK